MWGSLYMNNFDYRIWIEDIPYSISVNSQEGENVRIVVNQTVIFSQKCASWMKPRTDIMYFPFSIKDQNIVVSIDDRDLQHKYNIYVNEISPIDQKNLYDDFNHALRIINNGFFNYIKSHWYKVLLKMGLLGISFSWFALLYRQEILTIHQMLLVTLVSILLSPLILLSEWWFELRTVKKFKNRFRTSNITRIR